MGNMDCGSVYIKMCEKAEEIQDEKRKAGVFHGDYVYAESGSLFTHFTGIVELLTGNPNLRYGMVGCVFIPRQDQLQEMIGVTDEMRESGWKPDFICQWDWAIQQGRLTESDYISSIFPNGDYEFCESWEQLWLAIVMHEKYHKTWTGENWVAEK